jgi:hypothetical protein
MKDLRRPAACNETHKKYLREVEPLSHNTSSNIAARPNAEPLKQNGNATAHYKTPREKISSIALLDRAWIDWE